jgi:PKD repeat protein/DNA-binding transcriptional ArsR family regulator
MKFAGSFLICALMLGMLCLFSAVQVRANQPPVALAEPETQTIYAGEEAFFNGSRSYDDGEIVSYLWDFQEGMYGSGENASHFYNTPGEYNVTLTVTDDLGATDSMNVSVTVLQVPVGNASVWIESLSTNKLEYNATETITSFVIIKRDSGEPQVWKGSLIFEVFNESSVLVYNDTRDLVLPEISPSGSSHFEFNLTVSGDYLVRASLYDNSSEFMEKKETNILIISDPQNQIPVAVITVDLGVVNISEPVSFFGDGSYDPDGSIVSYFWEFQDGNTSSLENPSHVFEDPGDYAVSLTVADDLGATDYEVVTISVMDPENEPPSAEAEPDFQKIELGDEVFFSGDLSFDPDGLIISYQWDFGDENSTTGVNVSHIFSSSGNYTITLTVLDNSNSQSQDTVFVEVVDNRMDLVEGIKIKPQVRDSGSGNVLLIGGLGALSIFILTFATEAGRYRYLGLLIPLYTKLKKDEILDHYTRGEIHGYIVANPGDHYNAIKKALKLSDGSFAHHVRILEKEGIIKSARDGTHRRFYPKEMQVPENGSSLKKSQLLL